VWKKDGWRFNLDGRYVGKQFINQQDISVTNGGVIHPFFVMNMGVSKTIDVEALGRTHQVRFGVNVDNLLDRYYFNQAFSDTSSKNTGKFSYTAADVAAPRSVIGSITVAF
jgi:outer membrane receptor protein involved in Fe transport